MRKVLAWACILAWSAVGYDAVAAAAKKKSSPTASSSKKASAKKTTSSKSAKSTASARKSPARKASSKKRVASSKKKAAPRTTWRNRQSTPAPERYKEIQDALAAKGYLSAEDANGAWGPTSIAALKQFQAEQNLQPTGKINSISLIALGLGPKYDSAVALQLPESTEPQPSTQ